MTRKQKIVILCFVILLIVLLIIEYGRIEAYKSTISDLSNKIKKLELSNAEYKDEIKVLSEENGISDSVSKVPETTAIRNNYIEFVKSNLKLNLTKNKVEALLGSNYKIVHPVDGMLEDIIWRYDMLYIDGYQYDEEMDNVDLNGLISNDIGLIMFISFSEDSTVNGFSLYYNGPEEDSVYEFRLSENQGKETRIR